MPRLVVAAWVIANPARPLGLVGPGVHLPRFARTGPLAGGWIKNSAVAGLQTGCGGLAAIGRRSSPFDLQRPVSRLVRPTSRTRRRPD
jgi:hypothetical protein